MIQKEEGTGWRQLSRGVIYTRSWGAQCLIYASDTFYNTGFTSLKNDCVALAAIPAEGSRVTSLTFEVTTNRSCWAPLRYANAPA